MIFQMPPYFSYHCTQIAISSSMFMTVVIAYERSFAVRHPLKYSQYVKTANPQSRCFKVYLMTVIAFSTTINMPHFLELEIKPCVDYSNSANATHVYDSDNSVTSINAKENVTRGDDSTDVATVLKPQLDLYYTTLGQNSYYICYYRNWFKLFITGVITFALLVFFNTSIYKAARRKVDRKQSLTFIQT